MKSLPDSEIMQLATKPGPKQYLAFDDSEIMQLATKPGPKQYLAFDEPRRIRYNPSSWRPPAGPWPWNALDITRAPNASEMEWAFLKWSQELNDGKHHKLEQEQDARLKELERHLGQEPESLASKYFNAIGAELHRQREKAAE